MNTPSHWTQSALAQIKRVKYEDAKGVVQICRLVLSEITSVTKAIDFLFVPEVPSMPTFRIPLDDIERLSVHYSIGTDYSRMILQTKQGRQSIVQFLDGRLRDVVDILENRRYMIPDRTGEGFVVITRNPQLRSIFLLDTQTALENEFEVIDLNNTVSKDDFLLATNKSTGVLSKDWLETLQKQIRVSGLAENAMLHVWPYLLGIHSAGMTSQEKLQESRNWEDLFHRGLLFVESFTPEQLNNFPTLRDSIDQIQKDVHRTDTENPFFNEVPLNREKMKNIALAHLKSNMRINHGQGMLDCIAIFLQVARGSESLAFAMYSKFMERHCEVFGNDYSAVNEYYEKILSVLNVCNKKLHTSLHSTQGYIVCNTWIRVWLKRCFPYQSLVQLWTMIFNRQFGSDTLVYIIVAIFILKSAQILTIDRITLDTIFLVYRDISDIPIDHINVVAQECRMRFRLSTSNKISQ